MALEAEAVEERVGGPTAPDDRRASTERRGRERRQPGNRINKQAPRRSLLQALGVSAAGMSSAVAAIIFLAGEMVVGSVLWLPLGLALAALGFAILAFMIGCVEQRLIEIRLELMMASGGSRQADRRQGDRRA